MNEELVAELEAGQTIREQPFRSDKAVIGPFIAWFRTVWNNISTRWYVLPLLQQQNEFNALLVSYLRAIDGRLIDLDRDHTSLTRNVAELTYQLIRMNRLLTAIEAELQDRDIDLREV